jgi:hypothetical protein
LELDGGLERHPGNRVSLAPNCPSVERGTVSPRRRETP